MKAAAVLPLITLSIANTSAAAQAIHRMIPGEVRIVVLAETFDRLLMPPVDTADVTPISERRVSVIAYKPGRFNVVGMRGEIVAASFWVVIDDPSLHGRTAVTVYRNAKPNELYSCSSSGACTFYKDLRPPPPPLNSAVVVSPAPGPRTTEETRDRIGSAAPQ